MLDTKWKGSGPVGRQEPEPDDQDCIGCSSTHKPEPNPDQERLAAELAAVRKHLEHRAETNRIIASWRDELRLRIERTNLKAELIGISAEEHDALVDEVADFKRLCRALSWDPAGRRRT